MPSLCKTMTFCLMALMLAAGMGAQADEARRAKVRACASGGAKPLGVLSECAGFQLTPAIVSSCLQGPPHSCNPSPTPQTQGVREHKPGALTEFGPGNIRPGEYNQGGAKALAADAMQQRARNCAAMAHDVDGFVRCTQGELPLSRKNADIVDCVTRGGDVSAFKNCLASRLFDSLDANQRLGLKCISQNASIENIGDCYTSQALTSALSADQIAGMRCAATSHSAATFVDCVGLKGKIDLRNGENARLLKCAAKSAEGKTPSSSCQNLAEAITRHFTPEQRAVLGCAEKRRESKNTLYECLEPIVDSRLSAEQKAALSCLRKSESVGRFATCFGRLVLGGKLSEEQVAAIDCASSTTSAFGFAGSAVNKLAGAKLTPEQELAASCVAETGGQLYVAAGCAAVRLTVRELEKCLTAGVGQDGCFGDSNDLVGKDGWTTRTLRNAAGDIVHGPGSSNDLVGSDGFVVKTVSNAIRDITEGVGSGHDLLGCEGFTARTIGWKC